MADTPSTTSSKKGSFGFLTRKIAGIPVWIIALVIIGGIYWYEKYGPGATSSASGSQAIDPATGVPYATELAEAQSQASAQGLTIDIYNRYPPDRDRDHDRRQPGGPPAPSPPGSSPSQVTVPDVRGKRANTAIGELESLGLTWHGSPERDPQHEYEVASQTPGPGVKVPKGSRVDLGFRQVNPIGGSAGVEGSTSPAAISAAQESTDAAAGAGQSRWRAETAPQKTPVAPAQIPVPASRNPAPKRTGTARPVRMGTK